MYKFNGYDDETQLSTEHTETETNWYSAVQLDQIRLLD